jgi:sRNA-binding carbon storage regulator CsrA
MALVPLARRERAMLTLTRRVGQTIYIGDHTCLTVYDRLRYHVMVGVLTPANVSVRYGDTALRPAILPGGEPLYLLTLLSLDDFWVGDVKVRVRFNPTYLGVASLRMRQVKIDIGAPMSVDIYREEIYLRLLQEAGECVPALPFSAWLHQAMHAVPDRAAA